jgi:hypothetical protein
MQYFLSQDVYSAFKKTLYGRAGDQVTVLSERGEIAIVEGHGKNRYPVLKSELRSESVPPKTPIPLPLEDKLIPTLKETKKMSKGQSSLF